MDGGHALYLMKMLEDETVNVANNRGYDGIHSINMYEATLVCRLFDFNHGKYSRLGINRPLYVLVADLEYVVKICF